MLPETAHPRQVVLQLRELDLELPFGGHGVLREDVEDQLRAIDDPRLEGVLELALLHGRKLVVDEQRLGARAAEGFLELDELALADVGARVRLGSALDELGDGLHSRRPRKLLQLCELANGIHALREHGDDEPALGLGTRSGIRLT